MDLFLSGVEYLYFYGFIPFQSNVHGTINIPYGIVIECDGNNAAAQCVS